MQPGWRSTELRARRLAGTPALPREHLTGAGHIGAPSPQAGGDPEEAGAPCPRRTNAGSREALFYNKRLLPSENSAHWGIKWALNLPALTPWSTEAEEGPQALRSQGL